MTAIITKKEFLSVPTLCGTYRYVFLHNPEQVGKNGMPTALEHKLVTADSGGTFIHGGVEFFAPNATHEDVLRQLVKAMRGTSARMFFKHVARKTELLPAWKEYDLEALREAAPRFVYIEECINAYFKDVLKTERLINKASETGDRFHRSVKCEENIRGNFNDIELRAIRRLTLLWSGKEMPQVMVSYSLAPSAFFNKNEGFSVTSLNITNKYALGEWPSLNAFFNNPGIKPVIEAWIEHSWTPEMKKPGTLF
ncbi:hypothetical protein pEaSNUABM9_00267 [Erwinia phage pEa_SNUABM_9]|nr:hypothetical protein pEaSNUABM9_00267 [Erwinia phage pEa_SNUABM_9]